MTNEKMMREAPVWRLMLSMSLPMILVMLVNTLYNMADVFFIGKTGDAMQVAAISLAGPVFSALSAFNTLIGFGGCTAASMALGEGDRKKVRQVSTFVVYASLFIGAALMGLLLSGMDRVIPFLGANEATAGYVREYLQILTFGTPLMLLAGALGNTVRADGDSRNAVVGAFAGTMVNLLLDPLMISVLHMGCRGAALATVIGNAVSCVLLLVITGKKDWFSFSIRDFTLKPEISLHVLSLGVPMAAGTLLMSVSHIFSNQLMVRYGNQAVAAQSVAGKVGMLIPMVIMGVCMGIQPAISFAFGARDRERLVQITRGTGIAAVSCSILLALLFYLFRDAFIQTFIDDPEILAMGRWMILGSLLGAPAYGLYQTCNVFLQGTGKVDFATLVSLLRQGIVMIPVLYLMEGFFGLPGIVFAGTLSDGISALIGLLLSVRWNRNCLTVPQAA